MKNPIIKTAVISLLAFLGIGSASLFGANIQPFPVARNGSFDSITSVSGDFTGNVAIDGTLDVGGASSFTATTTFEHSLMASGFPGAYFTSSSPGELDGGRLGLFAKNAADEKTMFGAVQGITLDGTDGAEIGGVGLYSMYNGSLVLPFYALQESADQIVWGHSVSNVGVLITTDGTGNIVLGPDSGNVVAQSPFVASSTALFTASTTFEFATAGVGYPTIDFTSSSPALFDQIPLAFRAKNSDNIMTEYARMAGFVIDSTAGSEQGAIGFYPKTAGVSEFIAYIGKDPDLGAAVLASQNSLALQLATDDGADILFSPDGGNVGINTTTPSSDFHVVGNEGQSTSTISLGFDGVQVGCFKVQDSDLGGWSYGTLLNGVVSWSTTSCE